MKKIRLQKYLALQGIASRRKCEEYISSGLVKVNDKIIKELGTKICPAVDQIEFNNKLINKKINYVYLMLNKPAGYITSLKQTDSKSPLVTDLINEYGRIYPIGRLDKLSTGLLLLTNDGELSFRLMHPSFQKEKEYIVTMIESISNSKIDKLREGIIIDGSVTLPAKVERLGKNKISIILIEGRNRQIRKMIQKLGNEVEYLHRIRVKNLKLGSLAKGKYRELTLQEVENLKK